MSAQKNPLGSPKRTLGSPRHSRSCSRLRSTLDGAGRLASQAASWLVGTFHQQIPSVEGSFVRLFVQLAVSMITGKSLRAASQAAIGAAGRQVGAMGITS